MLRPLPKEQLSLSPIERFWLAENVPGTYLSFFHKYELTLPVDVARLQLATAAVAKAHPLPFCRLQRDGRGRTLWLDERYELDPLQRIVDQSPEPYCQAPAIDPYVQCGIHIYYSGSTIWFQYHHICADGYGALQLERCFFTHYTYSNSSSATPAAQPANLQLEDAYRRRTRVPITLVGAIVRSTYGFWYLWRSMHANIVRFAGIADQAGMPVRLTCTTQPLDPAATERLVHSTRQQPHTVNDVVIAAVLRALHEGDAIPLGAGDVYRIVVPINMRNARDERLPCVNKMSLLYLDVDPTEVAQRDSLLSRVTDRMKFLKRHMGLVMWRSIMFGPKDVQDLRQYLHRTDMGLTCYVSNLGRIDGFPECVVDFEATPTLQHADVPIGLMVYTFGGRLLITAGYDAERIHPQAVERLIRRIRTELQELTARATP